VDLDYMIDPDTDPDPDTDLALWISLHLTDLTLISLSRKFRTRSPCFLPPFSLTHEHHIYMLRGLVCLHYLH